MGRRADFSGGDNIRDGGKGVVDLFGLGGACETRFDEFDRAAKEVAFELERLIGLGPAEPLVWVWPAGFKVGGTNDDPGALGNSMFGVT